VFWVISVYFNIRNTLPKSGTFLLGHPVYIYIYKRGAGEGWKRSVGPILREMMKYYLRVKEQRNIIHETNKRKANWNGHILRRNCLLQQVIEGKIKGGIEVTGRRGRRRRKLLDDFKERTGYSHLKEESSRSHYVESWLWKSFWTCRKTDC